MPQTLCLDAVAWCYGELSVIEHDFNQNDINDLFLLFLAFSEISDPINLCTLISL